MPRSHPAIRAMFPRLCLWILLGLLCLWAACHPSVAQEGPSAATLTGTGEALVQVGQAFVRAGMLYTAQCAVTPGLAPLTDFCGGFKTFAPRFQQAYPAAIMQWKTAVQAQDSVGARQAETAVLALAAELAVLLAQTATTLGGK